MIVTRLNLANLRAIEAAEFHFQTGFNLLVGVNGVGKTTVLDALRICMSRLLPAVSPSKARSMSFEVPDITNGFPFLNASMHLDLDGKEFRFDRLQWRQRVSEEDPKNLNSLRRQILETPRLRDRARNLLRELESSQSLTDRDSYAPERPALRRAVERLNALPLCVFYSTNRSVLSGARAKGRAVGGEAAAYAQALVPRSWNFGYFADWLRAQKVLASEKRASAQHLSTLQAAATRFVPHCSALRTDDGSGGTLFVDKAGHSLDVRQLSDGERGVLSMVLDLAQRLSQANTRLADPLNEGAAVVLIDEIDLHLHPKWQRQIVHHLMATFPCCQFIATTHSPQVIGEVEHDRIQIIADGHVYSPTHSYGVESSRVLEEILDSDRRTKAVGDLLSEVSRAIGELQFDRGRQLLAELVEKLGEDDPEVTRIRTLLDFVEGKK